MTKELTPQQYEFLTELAQRYGDMLTKYAFRFLGYRKHMLPLAQDAVQEAFLRAVEHADLLMVHENPAGWLVVSLRSILLSALRRPQWRREYLTGDVADLSRVTRQEMLSAVERWEQQERLADVMDAVAEVLTADEQSSFRDHFVEGFTMEETARREDVSLPTVFGRINRIRKKLKKI